MRLWIPKGVHLRRGELLLPVPHADVVDLRIGRTRALCNPRGHPAQNPAFDPAVFVAI